MWNKPIGLITDQLPRAQTFAFGSRAEVIVFDHEPKDEGTYLSAARAAGAVTLRQISDARQLLQRLADIFEAPPKMVLVSWFHPDLPGERLIQWIQQQPHLSKTKVMVVTRQGAREAMMGAHRAGAHRFICKEPNEQAFQEKLIEAFKEAPR